jgi:hypothetical protein
MIKPLFNAKDDEWVVMVGRYILNMGAIEMATRILIARIEGTDSAPIFSDDLAARIAFLRKRFPNQDKPRHARAMKAFKVATRHSGFRNIVAHGPLVITADASGRYHIHGIMNVTPKSKKTVTQLISLEELSGRVNESATVARALLEMQEDFPQNGVANKPMNSDVRKARAD